MQMKISRWVFVLTIAIALLLAMSTSCFATLEYDLRSGLTFNWYFDNPDSDWGAAGGYGYFHDYNGDGLPDYVMHQKNSQTDVVRLFCINTQNSATPKTYPGDRSAWREFTPDYGTFVPRTLHFIRPRVEKRTPDIILIGTNKASDSEDYSKFIFWRLNETKSNFPTEKTWSINVNSAYSPTIMWSDYSFNGDNYPDFFICNSFLNASNKFFIGCYSGLDGSVIWTKDIAKASDDDNTPLMPQFPGSRMTLQILPITPAANGDFDGDGLPDILLYYTYSYGSIMEANYGIKGKITMLKSKDGNYLAPYSGWWDIFDYALIFYPPNGAAMGDYNKDTYVDLQICGFMWMAFSEPPVVRVVDIKNRSDLFQTTNSDFGSSAEDLSGYFASPARQTDSSSPADVNADTWCDLAIYRMMGYGTTPLCYGIFNGYANGGANKGRKMWLAEGAPNNYAIYGANDWDGDGILDYALAQNPSAPDNHNVKWKLALECVGKTGHTLRKTFDYTIENTGPWDPAKDDFLAQTLSVYSIGDIDGDGQRDTNAAHSCAFDYGNDNTWELAYSRNYIFDNTPGASPPDITAEFEVKLSGEDRQIATALIYAYDAGRETFVDQNGDGAQNDIILTSDRAIFALSFTSKPSVTAADIVRVLLGKKEIPPGQEDEYDKNSDGTTDIADVVYLIQNP